MRDEEMELGRRRSRIPKISDNTLKIAGTILMTLYFFSVTVLQNGLLHVNSYTPEQLNALLAEDAQAMLWAGIASIIEVVGMIAVSIYAYLLVQGVLHTSSMKKYALSVLVFALISEVPYDLAMYGKVWSWESQNPLWTVFITLIVLWMMKYVENRGTMTWVMSIVAALGGILWTLLCNCQFGWGFVLIASALYLLRKNRAVSLMAGLGASLSYMTACMGFILIAFSSGERRSSGSMWEKYSYYVYYPLLLTLMAVWTWMRQTG